MIRPYLRDMINTHKAPLEGFLEGLEGFFRNRRNSKNALKK